MQQKIDEKTLMEMEKKVDPLMARISMQCQDKINVYADKAFAELNNMKKDNPFALAYVGECYRMGWMVEKDEKLAFSCFEESAKRGADTGMYYLGRAYEKGIVVAKDLEKAAYWYLEAAQSNVKMGLECFQYVKALMEAYPNNATLVNNAELIDKLEDKFKKEAAEGPIEIVVKNPHALNIFTQFYQKRIEEQFKDPTSTNVVNNSM